MSEAQQQDHSDSLAQLVRTPAELKKLVQRECGVKLDQEDPISIYAVIAQAALEDHQKLVAATLEGVQGIEQSLLCASQKATDHAAECLSEAVSDEYEKIVPEVARLREQLTSSTADSIMQALTQSATQLGALHQKLRFYFFTTSLLTFLNLCAVGLFFANLK
ncbi:hypothetical protein [Polycladidibacter hongkongensis]|uniref:hypothetical protein n=1 Tax=Polycladidibacter hongkongensis TaxID=1647556 RepID=UPI00082F9212|nr:hypothetical protein [Pseudovibrio hongkongensis]